MVVLLQDVHELEEGVGAAGPQLGEDGSSWPELRPRMKWILYSAAGLGGCSGRRSAAPRGQ